MIPVALFNRIAQYSHFTFGISVVWLFQLFFPMYDCTNHFHSWAPVIVFCVLVIYTYWKEFDYDYHDETPTVRGSSLEDFCVQVGGGLFGLLLIMIKHWVC